MLISIHGVKLYAHCYTSSEALASMLNAIQGVKLCGHCYTCSEALCSLLYMK